MRNDPMQLRGKYDPFFEAARESVRAHRDPTVSGLQRRFRLGYSRACDLMAALEGELVTPVDPNTGYREMLEELG